MYQKIRTQITQIEPISTDKILINHDKQRNLRSILIILGAYLLTSKIL